MEMLGKLAWWVTPAQVFCFGQLETSPDVAYFFINFLWCNFQFLNRANIMLHLRNLIGSGNFNEASEPSRASAGTSLLEG